MNSLRNKKTSACRIAVLDLGSNSIKLLVARKESNQDPHILLEKTVTTRLGEGMHHSFQLSEAAMKRTLDAIEEFQDQCKGLRIDEWKAVATSAVRDAKNRYEFEKRFKERFGFPLVTLSGEKEAELIYRGVTSDPRFKNSLDPIIVMDSGGGSAEWIHGTHTEIEKCRSLDLGCVRMTHHFLRGDPYTEDSYQELLSCYEEQLGPLQKDFSAKGHILIGTGGSIYTAAAMDLKKFDHSIHGHILNVHFLSGLVEELRKMTLSQRLELKNLPQKRSDIIVAGIALFVVALRILETDQIMTSLRGLKYGLLMEKLSAD